ncbi:hypothetical protein L228DRAFT_285879 [Xylona heveae TC161]|uniref:Uncharacterized protein n=1 Tax=Xylona heveae (strain CBS 132557 / TC161) TaxID=1328760 RepID=A0A164ZSZ7_XYLHT|nr:hypothetical protein L228DRAFT_285879 [Xylona heveae TC161]KZF19472.1 hypothetical protein L228DRAFT_285879 [Xylona heveae TC161]
MPFTDSPSSSPISFYKRSPGSSPVDSLVDLTPRPSSTSSQRSCAHPSWPRRSSLSEVPSSEPSAYISDADLFPDVFDTDAEPSSPRTSSGMIDVNVLALNPLPWCSGQQQQQPEKKRRRSSSSRKHRRPSKPMTPISEIPEHDMIHGESQNREKKRLMLFRTRQYGKAQRDVAHITSLAAVAGIRMDATDGSH